MDVYAENGVYVDIETKVVKIPSGIVVERMSNATRVYTMGARDPAFDLELDGSATHIATDRCGVETADYEPRQRRASMKGDVAQSVFLPSWRQGRSMAHR